MPYTYFLLLQITRQLFINLYIDTLNLKRTFYVLGKYCNISGEFESIYCYTTKMEKIKRQVV